MTQANNVQMNGVNNNVQMNEEDLMKYLGSCSRELLDELVLTFNDVDGLEEYQYAHSTKKKRNVIYRLIVQNKDFDKFDIVKDFHNYVSGSAEDIAEAKRQYKETIDSYKSGLDSRVEGLRLKFEIKDETRELQQEMKGQQECCKLIENGLKGYGKAVVAGHIIGKQKQVIASANYVAVKASKIASNQNLEDKSLEGVKTVMKNVNPGISNLVASLHTERGELNATAESLVVATSEHGRKLQESIERFKEQNKQPASVGG